MATIIPFEKVNAEALRILETAEQEFVLFYPFKDLPPTLLNELEAKSRQQEIKISIVFSQYSRAYNFPLDITGTPFERIKNLEVRVQSNLDDSYIANERFALVIVSRDCSSFEDQQVAWLADKSCCDSSICRESFNYLDEVLRYSELLYNSNIYATKKAANLA